MAYIYVIKNTINNKIYVGKTNFSIEERFKQHINDSKTIRKEKRPLYNAMRKYGVENFYIEEIEKVAFDKSSEREKYWIEYYHSYENGYNATKGGDGKDLYDHNLIIELIKQGKSRQEITDIIGCCLDIVTLVAKDNELKLSTNPQSALQKRMETKGTKIAMLDKQTEEIQLSFYSTHDAGKWLLAQGVISVLNSGVRSHINEACSGKRKSAYGYKWKRISI